MALAPVPGAPDSAIDTASSGHDTRSPSRLPANPTQTQVMPIDAMFGEPHLGVNGMKAIAHTFGSRAWTANVDMTQIAPLRESRLDADHEPTTRRVAWPTDEVKRSPHAAVMDDAARVAPKPV